MSNAKAMLQRVRRLERSHVSPLLKRIGSMEALEAHAQAGIDAGAYDPQDVPVVVSAVRRWLADEL